MPKFDEFGSWAWFDLFFSWTLFRTLTYPVTFSTTHMLHTIRGYSPSMNRRGASTNEVQHIGMLISTIQSSPVQSSPVLTPSSNPFISSFSFHPSFFKSSQPQVFNFSPSFLIVFFSHFYSFIIHHTPLFCFPPPLRPIASFYFNNLLQSPSHFISFHFISILKISSYFVLTTRVWPRTTKCPHGLFSSQLRLS